MSRPVAWAILAAALGFFSLTQNVSAQTTEFTYQGSLKDGGSPAYGSYDFEFLLFDTIAGPNQIGSTLTRSSVAVSAGVFSVSLDFGSQFPGASRFLEIHVRQTGGADFAPVTPRQAISTTPYAIKSLNADTATNATNAADSAQLGGLPPDRYVQIDINGNVGIGASPGSGSKLTVGGPLELTSGAIKFADATTQTTAGIPSVTAASPLTGNGTAASPLGITSPLNVSDVDSPGRQPVFNQISTMGALYTVPAGKRLVIEYFSAIYQVSPTQALPIMYLAVVSPAQQHFIPPETWQDLNASNRIWVFSKSVRMYVSAGSQVYVQSSGSPLSVTVCFTGYLVDVP